MGLCLSPPCLSDLTQDFALDLEQTSLEAAGLINGFPPAQEPILGRTLAGGSVAVDQNLLRTVPNIVFPNQRPVRIRWLWRARPFNDSFVRPEMKFGDFQPTAESNRRANRQL